MKKPNAPRSIKGLLAKFIVVGLLAAAPAAAQVPIAQVNNGTVIVKGKVGDVFGERFVLEDGSGRILVQTPPGASALSVKSGDTVTVVGLPRDRNFDASQILRENGEVVLAAAPPPPTPAASSPPPPPSSGPMGPDGVMRGSIDRDAVMRVLQQNGLTATGEPVRHPKHFEVTARTNAGKYVIVSFDRFGRLDEIEDMEHDDRGVSEWRAISPADATRFAQQAGFSPREPVERRKRHYEIIATGANGEMVELHMDLGGTIYKRVWIR